MATEVSRDSGLGVELQGRLSDNQKTALDLGLGPETTAGQFIASLTARTEAEIVKATKTDPDSPSKRAAAASEVARLKTSESVKEIARLEGLARAANGLVTHLRSIAQELDAAAFAKTLKRLTGLCHLTCISGYVQFSANCRRWPRWRRRSRPRGAVR
jgi:hypothetical protein